MSEPLGILDHLIDQTRKHSLQILTHLTLLRKMTVFSVLATPGTSNRVHQPAISSSNASKTEDSGLTKKPPLKQHKSRTRVPFGKLLILRSFALLKGHQLPKADSNLELLETTIRALCRHLVENCP